MAKKRIILFGGTFDPIHLGHTGVAKSAFEHIAAQELIFVPAKRSPLKGFDPLACDRDRLAMIETAVENEPKWRASDYEITKETPSYTLHTVRAFKQAYGPQTSIYWLVGADSVKELSYWYGIEELIDLCHLSVMYRGGCDKPDFDALEDSLGSEKVRKLKQNVIPTPMIDISSTEIRHRLMHGEDVSGMVGPNVLKYINEHALYRGK